MLNNGIRYLTFRHIGWDFQKVLKWFRSTSPIDLGLTPLKYLGAFENPPLYEPALLSLSHFAPYSESNKLY